MPEWDENKRLANLANHGVIAMAPMGRRLHVVVYVERNGERRYISARKANSLEIAYYEKQMASPHP